MAADVHENEAPDVDRVASDVTPTDPPHGAWHPVMAAFSDLGTGSVRLLVASSAVAALLLRGKYRHAAFAVLAVQGATVIGRLIKDALDRPRPRLASAAADLTAAGFPGGWRVLLVGALVVLVVITWRTAWRPRVLLLTGIYVTWLALEEVMQQLDPVDRGNDSFPSGHAVGSMAVVATLLVLVWPTRHRWAGVVAGGVFVVAVGASRVYLGFHFPSDVLAGWAWALAWTGAMWLLLLRGQTTRRYAGVAPSRRAAEPVP